MMCYICRQERSVSMARVLVAEDDAEVRALIGAVLLDLMMPKASGFEVLAWMHRSKPGFAKRSVIVLTAMAEADLVHLTQERVFAVIRKPFDINTLAGKI